MIALFTDLGIDMYFDGSFSTKQISDLDIESSLSEKEIISILQDCLRLE